MILLSGGSKSCHRGAGLVRNLLFSTKTRASIAQVPGILKALRKLQTSNDSDTQQRSTIALSMLIEYQQESGMLLMQTTFCSIAHTTGLSVQSASAVMM
jgi:hypothetical protein